MPELAQLQHAALALDRGDLAAAAVSLTQLRSQAAADPDVLELSGVLAERQSQLGEAERCYRAAARLAPPGSMAVLRLAALLSLTSRGAEAVQHLRRLAKLEPANATAQLQLAASLHRLGQLAAAEPAYRRAAMLEPQSIPAGRGLAAVLIDLGRPAEAETVLDALLSRPCDPTQRAELETARAAAQIRQRHLEAALVSYGRASEARPDLPGADARRAAVLQALGQTDAAVTAYRQGLQRHPLDLTAHRELNDLLYRTGRDGEFLASYDAAPADRAGACLLQLAKGFALLTANRPSEAEQAFGFVLRHDPRSVQALTGSARAHAAGGRFGQALDRHARAVSLAPEDPELRTAHAATLLQAGEALRAVQAASAALAMAPTDQSALATLGLAWRAAGDRREAVLNAYHTLIGVLDLEPPQGYADMETFNADLAAALRPLHGDRREHFDQSLRGGTRMFGQLFDAGHELAERLREQVEAALARYVAALPMGEHPFLSRRGRPIHFLGSWSSRICGRGFHANHIHPGRAAWISACYYVSVPEDARGSVERAGWIKFGEPAVEFGFQGDVRHAVEPRPGRLVLFPSYMWHGTYAYPSSAERLTVAFDLAAA